MISFFEFKNILPRIFVFALLLLVFGCDGTDFNLSDDLDEESDSNELTLIFTGPEDGSWKTGYVAWIEDVDGNDIQDLYVCNRIAADVGWDTDTYSGLYGTAFPNWATTKCSDPPALDGVTGASVQGSLSVTRTLDIGSVSEFYVCFEVDRSCNSNDYFYDRPAYTYKSDLITLDSLDDSYDLSLHGWMGNDSGGDGTFSQEPIDESYSSWFTAFNYSTELDYIADSSDLVTTLSVTVQ